MKQRFLASCVFLFAAAPAPAADKVARLTIEVKVEGAQSWQEASDWSKSKISESYRLVTQVKAEGEPDSVNTKDPQYAQKQMAIAAGVQQKLREAQARSDKPAPRQPATQAEYIAQQKKMAEDMQKGQAACKGDMNCMMQLAQKYAQQSAMITPPGVVAEPVDEDGGEAEDNRYLSYFGYEGCPGEIRIVVDHASEGASADVSGMVPFKQSDTADWRGTELNRKMQCLGSNLVYDLKARKIYTDGIGHPAVRGTYRYWDRLHGETLNQDAEVITNGAAWDWVARTLRVADATGSASTVLPVGKAALSGASREGKTSGQIKVSLSWKFEPL